MERSGRVGSGGWRREWKIGSNEGRGWGSVVMWAAGRGRGYMAARDCYMHTYS